MTVICHFVFFVLEEGLDEEKRSMTLKSELIIKMNINMKKKRKTHPHVIDLCPQTSTKKATSTDEQAKKSNRWVC